VGERPQRSVGAWLRGQRGNTLQDEIVARLKDEQGVQISRSWLSRAENGAPISAELLRAFERLYGSSPLEEPEAGTMLSTSDTIVPAALIHALAAQTEALTRLAAALERVPDLARMIRAGEAAMDEAEQALQQTPRSRPSEGAELPADPPAIDTRRVAR